MIMKHNSHSRSQLARVAAVTLATAFLGACDMSSLGIDIAGGGLEKISLSGPSVVQVGDTIRLTASGSVTGLIGLLFLDRILDARFTVSDPNIATIQAFIPPKGDTTSFASVLVRGEKVGRVDVKVSARSKSDMHPVDVVEAGP